MRVLPQQTRYGAHFILNVQVQVAPYGTWDKIEERLETRDRRRCGRHLGRPIRIATEDETARQTYYSNA